MIIYAPIKDIIHFSHDTLRTRIVLSGTRSPLAGVFYVNLPYRMDVVQ